MHKKFVIIGGDAAGMSAASKIRRLLPDAEMIVFEQGEFISYAACGMPYWLSGVIEDGSKLQVLTPDIARTKRGINVQNFHRVLSIDVVRNQVLVEDLVNGTQFEEHYDKLLIATGARAVMPPIPGVDLPGVFSLRSLADGHLIKNYLAEHEIRHATIIGAGYIGLEMAESFRQLDIQVSMVEMLDQIAPTFDKDIMQEIEMHVREQGVDLRLETSVISISQKGPRLHVNTSEGDLETDMILVSTGVRPNAELAASAGIACGRSGAIQIDKRMRTSNPDIYAAGDCAEHEHLVLKQPIWIPLAPAANRGGRVAGENMADGDARFPGILGTAVVKVFDYTIAQTGLTERQAQKAGLTNLSSSTITAGSKAHYYPGSTPVTIKLVVDQSSGRLLGAQMIGRADVAKRLDVLATAITAGMTVEEIGMLDLTYAPPVAPVYDPIHVAANVASK